MGNKKKIFYIIIPIIVILLIILFYIELKKSTKVKDHTNEIQEEQNVVVENTEGNIIENVENYEQNVITDEVVKTNIENNTAQVKSESFQNKEVEQTPARNTNVTSTFDENAFVDEHLKEYPGFGEQYATLKISKIEVNAPIYFGATDEIILQGVGHDSGSYFCGENGTIIMCEHNYMNNFKRLGELINGDIVEVQTSYGYFYYKIYDEQIVLETEKNKLPIQHDEELLMIYTCYPSNNIGHTPYRYVIYAKKI